MCLLKYKYPVAIRDFDLGDYQEIYCVGSWDHIDSGVRCGDSKHSQKESSETRIDLPRCKTRFVLEWRLYGNVL